MSRTKYFFAFLIFYFMIMVWYRSVFFRSCPNLSERGSLTLLWTLTAGISLFMYVLTRRKRRSYEELFLTLFCPFGIYAVLSYRDIYPSQAILIAVVVSAGSLLLLLLEALVDFTDPVPRSYAFRKFLRAVPFEFRRIVVACTAPFLAALMISRLISPSAFISLSYSDTLGAVSTKTNWSSAAPQAVTLEDNLTTLLQFREETWCTLSKEEKLTLLQLLTDIQRTSLGLPFYVTIKEDPLTENTLGSYMPATHSILINSEHLEHNPSREVALTIYHEIYHAYQYCLANLYMISGDYQDLPIFSSAKEYLENFQTYESTGKDGENFENYYTQTLEIDARDYAEQSMQELFWILEFSQ